MQRSAKFIGIDISKLTLDICVVNRKDQKYARIENQTDSIKRFFEKLIVEDSNFHISIENTGCYNYHLYQALNELSLKYYVILLFI